MKSFLDIRDLLIRAFVIAVTSIILVFVTQNNNFDLHFKLRKPQATQNRILIIDLPENKDSKAVMEALWAQKPSLVLNQVLSPQTSPENRMTFSTDRDRNENIHFNFQADDDGFIRRALIIAKNNLFLEKDVPKQRQVINFRGPADTFPSIHYFDILNGDIDLENKIIILRPHKSSSTFATPVGLLSSSELVATLIDNFYENRFIPPKNFFLTFFILALTLIFSIILLIYLPSTLALVSSIAVGITYVSLSLWFFDNYAIWSPILVPIVQMFLSFLLISNYKFVLNERTRWDLEKESLYSNQLEEMKTNFLSLFSHDLKTPLAKIIGISDTLRSKISDKDILKEIEKINLASKELEKYIKRILKMSQVQSKNIALKKEPQDLNQLIEKAIEQNRFAAQEKEIHIDPALAPLFMIDVDGDLILEVIINFIENAIRYSPKQTKIIVKSEEINKYIKVSVKDQGFGIPKSAQDNIWEKYYRFNSDKSGYGLGLFLSRYVIHLHGGQVFLNSKENVGSEFGFILPFEEE